MINADLCHELLLKKMTPKLSNKKEDQSISEWKTEIKNKFVELTGLDKIKQNACPLNIQIQETLEKEEYRQIRFTFESEVGETVPCYLLIPKTGKKKYPVAITLQGHSTGYHLSIGEQIYEKDKYYQPRAAYALQAVKNGFAALAIEQRGMGIKKPTGENRANDAHCRYAAMVALQLGRTIMGERIWDVHKAIDALSAFPECDLNKIAVIGHSGGGAVAYYTACYDERVKLCMSSCSICPYQDSIMNVSHCVCNFIPSAYEYFEMPDLSCLIAPRDLILVMGVNDKIFPIEGTRRGFEIIRRIYAEQNVSKNCLLAETPKDHWWCADIVWNAVNKTTEKLGWFGD